LHKNALFLLKNCKNRPDPLISGGWGLRSQICNGLWRLGAPTPDLHQPPLHSEIFATPLCPSSVTFIH